MRFLHTTLGGLALVALLATGCGRETEDAEVKLVGVGNDPEEIGPTPTAYGGVVELDHVQIAGAGLSLSFLGLLSYDELGPGTIGYSPPFEAVYAFSYIFDERLSAAATLANVIPTPPVKPDSCYTQFEPSGPLGSFTTVDVGDYMEFVDADGNQVMRMGRNPSDYPPDPQNMFVYYLELQSYWPQGRSHWVPGATNDPRDMTRELYRGPNFPFGTELHFGFPGGLSTFDQPVSSIPLPSRSQADNTLMLPAATGGVLLDWTGDRYRHNGDEWEIVNGPQSQCFEFYGDGRTTIPEVPADCLAPPTYPTSEDSYDSFQGQMYTAPWDTEDDRVTFRWDPGESDDQIILSVRFLSELDWTGNEYLQHAVVEMSDGEFRDAQQCELGLTQDDPETGRKAPVWQFDYEGQDNPALAGDPSSRMAEVTCLLENDGEFDLMSAMLDDARSYAMLRGTGGVVFMFARGTEAEAEVPDAKDRLDQRREITPVRLSARAVKLGRFWWDGDAVPASQDDGGGE